MIEYESFEDWWYASHHCVVDPYPPEVKAVAREAWEYQQSVIDAIHEEIRHFDG